MSLAERAGAITAWIECDMHGNRISEKRRLSNIGVFLHRNATEAQRTQRGGGGENLSGRQKIMNPGSEYFTLRYTSLPYSLLSPLCALCVSVAKF
jgi:hypothetical protein